jgi:predicted nucleic acid-binding protein
MNIFIDTSAFLSILDDEDPNHAEADQFWQRADTETLHFVTTNYVITETLALVQRRLGMAAVRAFLDELSPVVQQVEWIDAQTHAEGVIALMAANRRLLGIVDCVSFIMMRRLGISTAFAFDEHFEEQGFTCIP